MIIFKNIILIQKKGIYILSIVFILNFIFLISLYLITPALADGNDYYFVMIKANKYNTELMNIKVSRESEVLEPDEQSSVYYYKVVGKENQLIKERNIYLLDETLASAVGGTKDESILIVKTQFNEDADKIIIYNRNDEEKLRINVAKFGNCGNGNCDSEENYQNCAADCASGSDDGYCDRVVDGICDIDCQHPTNVYDFDCPENRSGSIKKVGDSTKSQESVIQNNESPHNGYGKIILIAILIFFIAIIVAYLYLKRKREKYYK